MSRRRPIADPPPSSGDDQPDAARQLAAMVRRPKKRTPRNGPRATTVRSSVDQVRAIASDPSRWDEMTPALFVAMYAWLHTEVYGVDPSAELAGKAGLAARRAAKTLVEGQFNGDRAEAVEFVRWAWRREKSREEWRRDNGRTDGRRMSWRLQFCAALVNEYRVSIHRQRIAGLNSDFSPRVETA